MTQPFLYPGRYSPGQFALNNNPELSQLITMFAGPMLGQMAGPGNFMPHMMPGQALMDQFAMRNYQNQTRQATFNLAGEQNSDIANRLLGMRSMFTGSKATDMNREQAMNMAGILNNPMTKTFMGMAIGPENLEMMLHGSRGDVQNLGNTINRIGYFRRDPGGGQRMDANSLEDLTTGVFSHLYEPQGDVNKLATRARAGDTTSMERLQSAAKMEDKRVVNDTELQKRLTDLKPDRVSELYNKYVQGGEATDAATQAKELTRFDRAIAESKVLADDEASVGQLQTRARKRPTEEMHGFMAGQVAQMTENLFQRGMLPPSIGVMDAKDRISAISKTDLDDATIDRLARKEAERDIMSRNDDFSQKFSQMTDMQKEAHLDTVSGSYRDKLKATKKEMDSFAAGGSDKSAEEILQMTGGEALAGNVDASRTGSRIKEYTESVKAVRDIFGDNGNPNAPMPALMAVLDQLTQGAMGSMNPAAVSTTLRQMQTLARETGTGMQQLGAISAHAGNLGQQLGIAPSITMQNVANTMGITKAAMDRGAFSQGGFGTRSKDQFMAETTQALQEGDASGNAKSMAALARVYEADKERFKGTELEAAMAAYNDPNSDGTYTFKDPNTGEEVTRNLYEDMGKGRSHAARALLQRSGSDDRDFFANIYDERTGRYQQAGRGYMTQKHERVGVMSQMATEGFTSQYLKDENKNYTGALEGMDQRQASELNQAITSMIYDSADMDAVDQLDYLEENMQSKLEEHFKKVMPDEPDRAKQAAAETFQKLAGGKDGRSRLNRLVGNLGQVHQRFYNQNMAAGSQRYGDGRDVAGMLEAGNAASRAEVAKRTVGFESHIGARASDYFLDIGERGEKFNLDQFMKAMAPVISDKDMLQQFAGEMGAGMSTMAADRKKYEVTRQDITALADKAKTGDDAARQKLIEYGGLDKDTQMVSQADLDANRQTAVSALTPEKLAEEYEDVIGRSGAHLTDEQKREELLRNTDYTSSVDKKFLDQKRVETGKRHMTVDEAAEKAAGRRLGTAKDDAASQAGFENVAAMQKAIDQGGDTNALQAGVSGMLREYGSGLDKKKQEQLRELVLKKGDAAQGEILSTLGLSKEEFEKGKGLAHNEKNQTQKLAEAAVAMQGASKYKDINAEQAAKGGEADAKQKVDKANIDATTVVVNADRIEGKGGSGGTTPDKPAATPAAAPAASAPPAAGAAASGAAATQQPSGDVAAIDAEMNKLLSGMKSPSAFGRVLGYKDEFASPEDEKRYRELSAQKQAIIEQQRQEKTSVPPTDTAKPDKPLPEADGTATPAETPHKAPEAPAATPAAADVEQTKAEQQAAAGADTAKEAEKAQQNPEVTPVTPSNADKALEPVATTEDAKTAEDLQQKTAKAAIASAAGAEAAQAAVPDKVDIDKDSLNAVPADSTTYMGLPGGKVRDKDGNEVKLTSETNRWDQMYTRKVSEDQRDKISGRVGQVGDKHYEEYFDSKNKAQWREVSVGDIEGGPSGGGGLSKRNRDGLDALLDLDGLPAQMLGGDNLADIHKAKIASGEMPAPTAVKTSGPQFSLGGMAASLISSFGPKVETTLQEGADARAAARAAITGDNATSLPAEKTSAIQQSAAAAVEYSSANINPAASALQAPQQASSVSAQAPSGGGSGNTNITINGRLSLDGLQEAILDATGQKAVQTPGGGVPVVTDPPRKRVGGGPSPSATR